MPGDAGQADKPQVTLRIRTLRALKKYVKEPKCLCCGYDLRGQYMAGLSNCSECGQACSHEDIAEQISGQRAGKLPVLTEIRFGVSVAFAYPVFALLTTLLSAYFLFALGSEQTWPVLVVLVGHGVGYLSLLAYSVYVARRAFGQWRGVLYWFLSFIYGLVFVAAVQPIAGWVLILFLAFLFLFSPDNETFYEVFSWWWIYPAFVGAVIVLILNEYWSRRLVVTPCRRRCRELVIEMLSANPEQSGIGSGISTA